MRRIRREPVGPDVERTSGQNGKLLQEKRTIGGLVFQWLVPSDYSPLGPGCPNLGQISVILHIVVGSDFPITLDNTVSSDVGLLTTNT